MIGFATNAQYVAEQKTAKNHIVIAAQRWTYEGEQMIKCKTCVHDASCAAWIHHGKTLYDDFEYNVENCPYYAKAHGRIISTIKNGKMNRVFSCCNTDFTQLTMWITPNYCPNCGAKVDGKSHG